jgi:phage internal scaffolding protein
MSESVKIRSAFDRERVGFSTGKKSRVIQSAKDECDINNILKKYQKTGLIKHVNDRRPQYVDLPGPVDFQESLNIVKSAMELFESLPSSIRSRFENDPVQYLDFVQNPDNAEELYSLGILERPEGDPEPYAGPPPSGPTQPDPEPAPEGSPAE